MSDIIERDQRSEGRKEQEEFEKPVSANRDRKKIDPRLHFLHGIQRAENCNKTAYTRRSSDDRDVGVARDQREEDLQNSANRSREQIQPEKPSAAERLFHAAAEKIKSEAIEQDMPWPGSRMKELKSEQLPDFSMKQPVPGEREVFVDLDSAIEEQGALNDE